MLCKWDFLLFIHLGWTKYDVADCLGLRVLMGMFALARIGSPQYDCVYTGLVTIRQWAESTRGNIITI